jgi:hypothetical protein
MILTFNDFDLNHFDFEYLSDKMTNDFSKNKGCGNGFSAAQGPSP